MGKHQRLKEWLLGAATVQEFIVRLGESRWVEYEEALLVATIRDALGEVMNKTTPTWVPCTVENMHKALGTTGPPSNEEKP